MTYTHFLLTRYNIGIYDRDDAEEWMFHRSLYFQKCRQSVLSQGVQIKWVIFFDPRTPEWWMNRILSHECMIGATCGVLQFPYLEHAATDWIVTTRLDNDDMYLPGALKAIQAAIKPEVMCIDIDYYGFNGLDRYTSGRGSATSFFISLVEHRSQVKTVYYTQHNHVRKKYPVNGVPTRIPDIFINNPLAVMHVHGWNLANKIQGVKI